MVGNQVTVLFLGAVLASAKISPFISWPRIAPHVNDITMRREDVLRHSFFSRGRFISYADIICCARAS